MTKQCFVFDASALALKYIRSTDPASKAVQSNLNNLFHLRAQNPHHIDFQIPSICMAECSKAFARACFEKHIYGYDFEKAKRTYHQLRDNLLKDVSEDRIIHSYELKRDHFRNIEDIFVKDFELPPPRKNQERLSSHDVLIISMAAHIGSQKGMRNVAIVTADERIGTFCGAYKEDYPDAINILKDRVGELYK